jgi:magnesium transporter
MIQYWKCLGGFKQIEAWEANCWIKVTKPTTQELLELESKFSAPLDFMQDIEDSEERPRTESEGGWLMNMLRIPYREVDEDNETFYNTLPLGILVRGEVFITICYSKTEMIADFIKWTNRKNLESRQSYDLILSLFLSSSVWYLKYLKQMNAQMKEAEEALEESMDNEELHRIMKIERFLVFFITSLRGNEVVLVRLKRYLRHLSYDEDLMDDVEVELQQAYATANIYSNILERERSSYSSIISNNLNAIMKRLTVITIILMIPTGISSFFGMNLINGLESWCWGFPFAVLLSIVVSIVGYIVFRKQKLF